MLPPVLVENEGQLTKNPFLIAPNCPRAALFYTALTHTPAPAITGPARADHLNPSRKSFMSLLLV